MRVGVGANHLQIGFTKFTRGFNRPELGRFDDPYGSTVVLRIGRFFASAVQEIPLIFAPEIDDVHFSSFLVDRIPAGLFFMRINFQSPGIEPRINTASKN